MTNLAIHGITEIAGPQNLNSTRGRLDLPLDFDSKKFAARWAKKGNGVERQMQRQAIIGTTLETPGWTVYKDAKGRIHQRSLRDGAYILMVRPLALQKAILAVNGNTSKRRMVREANNETVEGEDLADTGMIPSKTLEKLGLGREDIEPLAVQYNEVEEEDTRRSTAARVSSKAKVRK